VRFTPRGNPTGQRRQEWRQERTLRAAVRILSEILTASLDMQVASIAARIGDWQHGCIRDVVLIENGRFEVLSGDRKVNFKRGTARKPGGIMDVTSSCF